MKTEERKAEPSRAEKDVNGFQDHLGRRREGRYTSSVKLGFMVLPSAAAVGIVKAC